MLFTKDNYQKIYNLMSANPFADLDCGILCENACCKAQGENLGIYLLPGEEQMYSLEDEKWLVWEKHDPQDFDFPDSWIQTVYFVKCIKECPRDKRPIQCRTFPLAPHLKDKKSNLILIWESLKLPYSCPLIVKNRILNPDYIQGLKKGWDILIKNPLIKDLVIYDSLQRKSQYIEYKD